MNKVYKPYIWGHFKFDLHSLQYSSFLLYFTWLLQNCSNVKYFSSPVFVCCPSAASLSECHVSSLQDLVWEPELRPPALLVVVVPALPKGAAVELHVTAIQDDYTERTSCHVTAASACGPVDCCTVMSADKCSASLSLSLIGPGDDQEVKDVEDIKEVVAATFKESMKKMDARLVPLCARVFYKCGHSLAQQISKGMWLYFTQGAAHQLQT